MPRGEVDSGKGKARGMTLIEVLVAIVLLVLVFIFIAENMIASSWAESKASQRTINVSAANYLLAILHGDPNLWSRYPDTPNDACGSNMTPVDDAGPNGGGSWHTPPACAVEPPSMANVQYQWQQTAPVADASDITIWVMNTVGGKPDVYEIHSFTHMLPPRTTLPPPPPSPPPPSPSHPPTTPPPSTPPPTTAPPTTPPPPTATPTPPPPPTTAPPTTPPPPSTPPPTTPPPTTPPPPTPTPTATPIDI